jgi:uncharacterized protein YjbI with pentapeptide repeats
MFGVTVIFKMTFALLHDRPMQAIAPLDLVREDRYLAPGGSLLEAMETAPYLPNAGVVLTGHACAPGRQPVQSMTVRLALFRETRVLDKSLQVTGDRAHPTMSPQPFLKVPLVYERAHGGPGILDNPVGTGQGQASRLPNIVVTSTQHGSPAFGPISRHWPVRARFLAAFDANELAQPVAVIPQGFDWKYFQAAPRDQQLDTLHGDEWVVLDGLHPDLLRLQSRLPFVKARARWHTFTPSGVSPARTLDLSADTLVIDADKQVCSLIWRGYFVLESAALVPSVTVVAGVEQGGQPLVWPTPGAPAAPPVKSVVLPQAPAAPVVIHRAPAALTATTAHDLRSVIAAVLPFGSSQKLPVVNKAPAALTSTSGLDFSRISSVVLPFAATSTGERHPGKEPVENPPAAAVRPPYLAPDLTGLEARTATPEPPPVMMAPLPFTPEPLPIESTPPPIVSASLPFAPQSPPAPLTVPPSPAAPELGASPRVEPVPAAAEAVTGVRAIVLARLRAGSALHDLNLAGADLHDLDFSETSLAQLNLKGANLSRCLFTNARLAEVKLGGADLTEATLSGADLTSADLTRAVLTGARLDGCNLTEAILERATGDGADFSRARLPGADLRQSRFQGARFDDAVLREVSGNNADLTRSRFVRACLDGALLRGAKLGGANLSHADFGDADFREADFDGANVHGAQRKKAKLNGANTKNWIETDPGEDS